LWIKGGALNCIDIIRKGISYRIYGLEKICLPLANKILGGKKESVLHNEIKHENNFFFVL
jgi:hypothetical protein